jgi:site-specific recombinase XerC
VLRDRAILLLGWSGALRRSEIVGLDRADLRFVKQGVEITLRRSKTNQEGDHERVAIPLGPDGRACPVCALADWVARVPQDRAVGYRSITATSY